MTNTTRPDPAVLLGAEWHPVQGRSRRWERTDADGGTTALCQEAEYAVKDYALYRFTAYRFTATGDPTHESHGNTVAETIAELDRSVSA